MSFIHSCGLRGAPSLEDGMFSARTHEKLFQKRTPFLTTGESTMWMVADRLQITPWKIAWSAMNTETKTK